jgi:neopullulanase
MNRTPRRFVRQAILVAAASAVSLVAVAAQAVSTAAPEVAKVEPPNWWAGHSINPVRLLVRGRNLKGASVTTTSRGVRAGNVKVSDAGTYLFVDVTIDRAARPGRHPIKITTGGGSTQAPFEITPALPRRGNFQGFNQDDVIYLIMPDRFSNGDTSNDDPAVSKGLLDRTKARRYHGGDLQGVINRLPYLKDLGVTAIWLNPVYDNNNGLDYKETYDNEPTTGYHGYGATDFYAVDEHLGDVKKFRELVEKAHAMGLKVIQDQVANHTGPYHVWAKDAPTPTWFNGTEAKHLANNWQTHLLMDMHAPPELLKPVLDGWFIDILPDLNQDDPEAARYIIQNTLWWLGMTGLDAIRQDTLPYVPRRFWRDWMTAIKREHPNVNVVGETLDGLPAQVAFFQGGVKRFDGVDSKIDTEFDYPLFFALRKTFAQGQPIGELVNILNQDYLYPRPFELVTLLGSHDVPRFMGERGATVAGLKLAYTFLLTTRGIPQLYYGDEIALAGGGDPDNRRDFPGGWPGDRRNAFEASGRTAEENQVFDHVRRLLRLRAELEPLRRGRLTHVHIAEQQYVYARLGQNQTVIVAVNNAARPAEFEAVIPQAAGVAEGRVLKDRLSGAGDVRVVGGKISLKLPARSAVILQ